MIKHLLLFLIITCLLIIFCYTYDFLKYPQICLFRKFIKPSDEFDIAPTRIWKNKDFHLIRVDFEKYILKLNICVRYLGML